MDDESDPRGRTVGVAAWWRAAAKAKLRDMGITQQALARELGISAPTLSRNLGTNVNVEDVEAIAGRLDLPRPVFLPRTEAEARAIEHLLAELRRSAQDQLRQQDSALASIEASARRTAGVRRYEASEPASPATQKRRARPRTRA